MMLNFAKSFFMAQLDEKEAKSEEMVLFQINQAISGRTPLPQKALKLINSLRLKKKGSKK